MQPSLKHDGYPMAWLLPVDQLASAPILHVVTIVEDYLLFLGLLDSGAFTLSPHWAETDRKPAVCEVFFLPF